MKTPHTITVEQIVKDDMYQCYASSSGHGHAKTLEGQVGGPNWRVTQRHTSGVLGGITEVVCEGTVKVCVETYNLLP